MIGALVTLLLSGLGPAEDEPFVLTELATPAGEGTAMPSLARGGDGRVYLTWVERRGHASGTLRLSVWNAGAWSDPNAERDCRRRPPRLHADMMRAGLGETRLFALGLPLVLL